MRKQFLMILLLIIFISSILLVIISKIKETKPETNEDFSFNPSPIPEVTFAPSKYATDSALLEIRNEVSKLKTVRENINNERIFFIPPQLDFGLKLQP